MGEATGRAIDVKSGRPTIVCGDARAELSKFKAETVSTIITSPPYGDAKDYGHERQIGHGQSIEFEYFDSMRAIFDECARILIPGGALWLVADNIRRGGALRPLPWQLSALAQDAGLRLNDIIIWDKGKTLPWFHKGRFRSRVEYIVLLAKGPLAKFDVDPVREAETLSPYWVRYPERYHPFGNSPSDLWHFPIPTQGSWSNTNNRHVCPFPAELVRRMILITSDPRDIVLDPFAGLGTVPHVATYLDRTGIGIEISTSYVEIARTEMAKVIRNHLRRVTGDGETPVARANVVAQLRVHKYAKVLLEKYCTERNLGPYLPDCFAAVIKDIDTESYTYEDNQWAKATIVMLTEPDVKPAQAKAVLQKICSRPPLSKFGVSVELKVQSGARPAVFNDGDSQGSWYLYHAGRFYSVQSAIAKSNIKTMMDVKRLTVKATPKIISELRIDMKKPSGG